MQRRSFLNGTAALAATPLVTTHGWRSVAAQDLSGELTLWHGWTGAEADTAYVTVTSVPFGTVPVGLTCSTVPAAAVLCCGMTRTDRPKVSRVAWT